jgi:hypothetical protein
MKGKALHTFSYSSVGGFIVRVDVESPLTASEEMLLSRAVLHAANKLGSHGFKQFCDSYHYVEKWYTGALWWKKWHSRIVHNFKEPNGRTSSEVYEHLMNAEESLGQGSKGVADITLVIDRRNKRGVLGYTYPNSVKQWVYSWVLRTDYRKVAGNLIHEWCHKMGYTHAWKYNSTRKHTVPYAVGDFVSGTGR